MKAKLCCCTGSDYCNSGGIEPDAPTGLSMGFGAGNDGVAVPICGIYASLSLIVSIGTYVLMLKY